MANGRTGNFPCYGHHAVDAVPASIIADDVFARDTDEVFVHLDQGRRLSAAKCHRQARAQYMQGFCMLLGELRACTRFAAETRHMLYHVHRCSWAVLHFVERALLAQGCALLMGAGRP